MFQYQDNSCYTDTLLMILFKGSSEYWVNNIIYGKRDPSKYSTLICKNKKLSPEEVFNYSTKVKIELVNLYVSISRKEIQVCTNLRLILNQCLQELKVNNLWVTYSPDLIYSTLCDLFPSMKITIPYVLNIEGPEGTKGLEVSSHFSMWDFMDPAPIKDFLWDTSNSEVLIFNNTGIPPIVRYNSTDPEYSNILGSTINKKRAFGELILGDKYILIGVITLLGYTLGTEGGEHYICHYLNKDGDWNYYDDLYLTDIPIQSLPIEGVWEYSNGKLPYMYFYQKAESFKIDILNKIKKNLILKNISMVPVASISIPQIKPVPVPTAGPAIPTVPTVPTVTSSRINIPATTAGPTATPSRINIPVIPTGLVVPAVTPSRINIPAISTVPTSYTVPVISTAPAIPTSYTVPVMSTGTVPISIPQISKGPVPAVPAVTPSGISIPQAPVIPIPKITGGTGVSVVGPIMYPPIPMGTYIPSAPGQAPVFTGDILLPIPSMFKPPEILPDVVPKKIALEEDRPTVSLPIITRPLRIREPPKNIVKGIIQLPTGSTIMPEVPINVSDVVSKEVYGALAYALDEESIKNNILDQIDISRLNIGKTSAKNNSYKLEELQNFARALSIRVNQKKDNLVNIIKELKLKRMSQSNR